MYLEPYPISPYPISESPSCIEEKGPWIKNSTLYKKNEDQVTGKENNSTLSASLMNCFPKSETPQNKLININILDNHVRNKIAAFAFNTVPKETILTKKVIIEH